MLIQDRWKTLHTLRSSWLQKARDCAALTVPSILPPEGHMEADALNLPWQSLGAEAVNNLASKLMLVLFPPNDTFFRLKISDLEVQKYGKQSGQLNEVEAALTKVERSLSDEFESTRMRAPVHSALLSAITTGAGLLYVPNGRAPAKSFRVDRFVVRRNPEGSVIEIITFEQVTFSALKDNEQKRIQASLKVSDTNTKKIKDELPLDLYTRCVRNKDDKWDLSQEIDGIDLPTSKGTLVDKDMPFIPIRWTSMVGEDSGRGAVELNLGDFRCLESLTIAMVEGTAAAAKILFLVNPGSVTRANDLAAAPNGGFRPGRAEDVTTLQLDKSQDFQVAFAFMQNLEQRVKSSFLMNSSVQRQAERVTAEEIRYMANELEASFGGVYSGFAGELQLPLVTRLLGRTKTEMPPGIKPIITTGLEGLGRNTELTKLQAFKAFVADTPEAQMSVRWNEYCRRAATHLRLDSEGLVKTDEELQAEKQQALQAQMMSQMAPNLAKAPAPTE